jgi:hypothetical protein
VVAAEGGPDSRLSHCEYANGIAFNCDVGMGASSQVLEPFSQPRRCGNLRT